MKTILVPADFSANSSDALRYAGAIASVTGAKIILLNVYHLPIVAAESPVKVISEDELETEAKQQLQKLVEEVLRKEGGMAETECLVRQGFTVDEIIGLTKARKVDMIVMGTHGASGLKQVVLGSNTASVIERSLCPVLAVPAGARFGGIKKITYATDYHDSDMVSLRQTAEIARLFDAELQVLHISAKDDAMEQSKFEWYKEFFRKETGYTKLSFHLLEGKEVEKMLHTYVSEFGVDLLVMATKKRNFFYRFFEKSLTRKMAYHTHVPLLAFHFHKDEVIFI